MVRRLSKYLSFTSWVLFLLLACPLVFAYLQVIRIKNPTESLRKNTVETPVGLGPFGGPIHQLAIDPQDPTTLYAGTWHGGLYKSTDGGARWSPINVGLTSRSVYYVAVDPKHSNIIYALTGFFDSPEHLFKSTNSGRSWSVMADDFFAHVSVTVFLIDPNDSRLIYAGTRGNGVLKTTDGGAHWFATNRKLSTEYVNALAFDPSDSAILYAGTDDGIFKSTNGGADWLAVNQRLQDVEALIVDPTDALTIYAGGKGGVFKSTNGGVDGSIIRPTDKRFHFLIMDPADPRTLYVGVWWNLSGQVWKSTDGGIAWSDLEDQTNFSCFRIDPSNSNILYAGSYRGISKSFDGGKTWVDMNWGISHHSIAALTIDPNDPATLYVGTLSGSAFKSTNRGKSWSLINAGLAHRAVAAFLIDPNHPSTLYAGGWDIHTFKGTITKSADRGDRWEDLHTGRPLEEIRRMVRHPRYPDLILAATKYHLIKSTDGGNHWSAINKQMPSPITAMALDSDDRNILYVGTTNNAGCLPYEGGAFKSTDGGNSWSAIHQGLTHRHIQCLAVDRNNPSIIYAGTGGGGLFKSVNGGGYWSPINIGLAELVLSTIEIDPKDSSTLYVGTPTGIFKSVDAGNHWSRPGFVDRAIKVLVIDPVDSNTIYAGTEANGILVTYNRGQTWN